MAPKCVRCGRLLCAACRTRWQDEATCPECIEQALGSGEPLPHETQLRTARAFRESFHRVVPENGFYVPEQFHHHRDEFGAAGVAKPADTADYGAKNVAVHKGLSKSVLWAGLVGLLTAQIFNSFEYSKQLWLLFGMAVAATSLLRQLSPSPSFARATRAPGLGDVQPT